MVSCTCFVSVVSLLLTLFAESCGKPAPYDIADVVYSGSGDTELHPADCTSGAGSGGCDWKDSESGDFDVPAELVENLTSSKPSSHLPSETRHFPTEQPMKSKRLFKNTFVTGVTTDVTTASETEITFSPEEEVTAFTPISIEDKKLPKDIHLDSYNTSVEPKENDPTAKPIETQQTESSLSGQIVQIVIITGAVILIVVVILTLVILPKIRRNFMSVPITEPKDGTKISPEESFLIEENKLYLARETSIY